MGSIATLPLSFSHHNRLGFYSIFAYLEQLSTAKGIPCVCLQDQKHGDAKGAQQSLIQGMHLLKIAVPQIKSLDTCSLDSLMQIMVSKEIIKRERVNILSCSCKKIQIRNDATIWKTKKTLVRENGLSICCSSALKTCVVDALIFPINSFDLNSSVSFYPQWAKKEIAWFENELRGKELLISRIGNQGVPVQVYGRHYRIDQDFLNASLLFLLNENTCSISDLVSGATTMRQAASTLIVGSVLGCLSEQLTVHFLPKVDYVTPPDADTSLRTALKNFSTGQLQNALLWAALSERQQIELNWNIISRVSDQKDSVSYPSKELRRNLLKR